VNSDGMQKVGRLLFRTALELADAPERPKFRTASRRESPATRLRHERAIAPAPSRLGLSWDANAAKSGEVRLTSIADDSPAQKAGLMVGDRIIALAGIAVDSPDALRRLALRSEGPVTASVQRAGHDKPIE